jgi:hypothetical protein
VVRRHRIRNTTEADAAKWRELEKLAKRLISCTFTTPRFQLAELPSRQEFPVSLRAALSRHNDYIIIQNWLRTRLVPVFLRRQCP